MKFLLLVLLLCHGIQNTHAYLVAKLPSLSSQNSSTEIQKDRPSHIVVAGAAHEAGMLFMQAAITRALKYRENYPEDQILFFAQHEGEVSYNESWLKKRGLTVIHADKKDLTTEKFVEHLKSLKSIRSLDFFTHSAASYGIQLSSITRGKIGPEDKKIREIKNHLTADATITLNGCNSGFFVAPAWSKALGVPVTGSLTSTDFQELNSDGQFYLNNPESRPATPVALDNSLSHAEPANCKLGLCIRMKPVNGPYNGYWGSYYEGGLPFYKMFCPGTTEAKCQAAYKKMVLNFVSTKNLKTDTSFEAYKEVVLDMLCPISAAKAWRAECVSALNQVEADRALETYSPFRGKQLQCDQNGCKFELDCPLFKKECQLVNTHAGKATTLTEEYKRYLEAY